MKPWIAAAAAAPLLVACASAGAQTAAAEDEETRILIVNGERILIEEGGDAAAAIEDALAQSDRSHRVVMEFHGEPGPRWHAESREGFARAMAELAERFGEDFEGEFDFDFDVDLDVDGERFAWNDADGERIEIMVRRMERDAERHAAEAERHAERHVRVIERQAARLERDAERMAVRIERHAAQAELHGLRAGVRGVEAGLASIERTLERGWYEEDGDRVELTDEKRADLEDARTELTETLGELRVDLAQAEARHGGEHREVRIVRRDGSTRGWVNGEEVTGSELDRLLEGAPDAPEAPAAPSGPRDEDG